jgi:hypothetical protein
MKNSAKKILSLLLAVVMMSSLATFALAAGAAIPLSADAAQAVVDNENMTITAYYDAAAASNKATLTAALPNGDSSANVEWVLSSAGNAHFVGTLAGTSLQAMASTVTNASSTVDLYLDGITAPAGITLTVRDNSYSEQYKLYIVTGGITGVTIYKDSTALTSSDTVAVPYGSTVNLTAAVNYTQGSSGAVSWSVPAGQNVAAVSNGAVTGQSVGKTAVTAASTADPSKSATVNVEVVPSVVISTDGDDKIDVGDAAGETLTAAVTPSGTYSCSWSASPANAVTFTPAAGASTKVTAGNVTAVTQVTVTCKTDNGGAATHNMTVYPAASKVTITDPSTNAAIADPYNMTKATKQLSYKTDPTGIETRGAVRWDSTNKNIATVTNTGLVTAVAGANGETSIICYYKNPGAAAEISSSFKLNVSTQTKAASNVSMSATNNVSTQMTAAHDGIYNAYYSAYGSYPTSGATITFNSIPRTNGSLYASSTQTTGNTVTTGKAYDFAAMSNMTYLPNKVGTETITYTLTSAGTGTATMNYLTGTLYIAVTSSNGTVTVNLDGSDPYVFSYSTAHDGQSAASSIYSSIMSSTGKAYSYLTFDAAPSSAVGTLYSSASGSAAAANAPFYYSGTSPLVSNLYFVPANSGTYSRTFKAYDGSGTLIFSGTLQIVVPTKPAAGDVSYSTAVSSSLMMDEADFISWYKAQTGSGYYLSSVTFDSAKYSNPSYPGYFQHNGKTFSPGNGVSYYTQSYNGTANSGGTYLNKVTYNSPIVTCNITVKFTCYGGTSKNSTYLARSGVMYICVNQNAPANIRYTVSRNAGMTLVPADFSNVYANVMNTSSAGSFYVTFLNAPNLGTMSVGYVNASRPGVTLTDANAASYSFYVNYSSGVYTIDDVTYTPGSYTGNSDTVKYAAYSINGQLLYIGEVDFVYGATSGTTCYSDGYNFTSGDFFKSSDTDPVYYVTFGQPSSGVLYYNYAHGSGTIVPKTVKFYTKYSSYGSYSVTAVEYIPAMGYSGTVSIPYTAYKSSGSSSTGSFTLSVVSKTNSTVFGDVTAANTGSWSANSVDFAYFWGLVTGSGAGTFSPRANMTRGQLVTILYNAAGSPAVSGTVPFSDVRYSDYYYSAVLWAYRNGIVGGRTSASFAPGANITREDFCVILYKYAAYTGRDTSYGGSLYGFSDAGSVSAYARTAMQWAVYHGYISGTNSYTLSPKGYASRAQVAVMLHSFLTKQ